MKTRYKHIHFEEVTGLATPRWLCENNKDGASLGEIAWMTSWKRFVFQPDAYTEFDSSCLRDIASFLDALKQEIQS